MVEAESKNEGQPTTNNHQPTTIKVCPATGIVAVSLWQAVAYKNKWAGRFYEPLNMPVFVATDNTTISG